MSVSKRRLLAAAASVISLGTTFAWADSAQDARVQQLKDKVANLEAQQAASSKDMAATIDSMLRDAEKRSQLLATTGDASAGYDRGFFIKAGDAWVLRPAAQFMFRNVTNYRDDAKTDGGSSTENGFEVRRMRFDLAGNAFTRDLNYFFQWDVDRDSGDFALLEGWARYFFSDEWGVRGGQFKDLVTHEFVMSSKRLLAADVSLMDSLIGGTYAGYTQGLNLIYGGARSNNDPLNIEAGYSDGAAQKNTSFVGRNQPISEPEPGVSYVGPITPHSLDWGIDGRVEYKLMGNWADYSDFTAKGTKTDLLVLGGGGDWSQSGDGDLAIATVDAQYENPNGLGLYTAGVARYMNGEITGLDGSTTDWGFLIQGSYLLTGNWELFARYDGTWFEDEIVFPGGHTQDNYHELTIGFNYYCGQDGSAGHRAKFTVDLTYLPNGSPTPETGLGILDNNGAEAEWLLRAPPNKQIHQNPRTPHPPPPPPRPPPAPRGSV